MQKYDFCRKSGNPHPLKDQSIPDLEQVSRDELLALYKASQKRIANLTASHYEQDELITRLDGQYQYARGRYEVYEPILIAQMGPEAIGHLQTAVEKRYWERCAGIDAHKSDYVILPEEKGGHHA